MSGAEPSFVVADELQAWMADKLARGEVPAELIQAAEAVKAAADLALAALADMAETDE